MSDYFLLLPQEILREIFKRLPAETLVKCTRVCKQWHSLITSPAFIALHLNCSSLSSRRRRCRPLLLLRHFTDPPRTQHFSFLDQTNAKALVATFRSPFRVEDDLFFRVVGCLHGLVCLSDDLSTYTGVIILWNPLIRRYLLLPTPHFTFDTLGAPYMFVLGFGFDSKKCDHKVVRIVYLLGHSAARDVYPPRVEVYSVKDGCWREIKGSAAGVRLSICEFFWSQCFVNGCVHWIAYERRPEAVHSSILLFDMSEEKFKKMELPECLLLVSPLGLVILEIGGCLGLLENYPSAEDRMVGCNVWVREEYSSAKSWTKMYSIDLEGVIFSVLRIMDDGEVLLVNKNSELASYDPKGQEMNVLGFQGFPEAFDCQPYVESLLLLDKDSRAASYGGAKKMEAKENIKKKKKKRRQKTGSTCSEQQDEVDTSFILVSEEPCGNGRKSTQPARAAWDSTMAFKMIYQMSKLRV